MHLPRLRFTVRRLMVAVAVVALAFPLFRIASFYRNHLHAALSHRESEKYHALELKNLAFTEFHPLVPPERRRALLEQWVSRARQRERYHAELKRKYERASTRPWDPVEPDQPMPE